jgi:hypothetical protein
MMLRRVFRSILLALCATVCANAAAPASTGLGPAQIDNVLNSAHAAAGGAALDAFGATSASGTFSQNGGAPASFDGVTDLRDGYSKSRVVIGPATLEQGYDGTEWTYSNGALSIVSLPSFVADAVTGAYLSSNAYLRADQRGTVTSGRSDVLDGRPAYVLHVQPVGGNPADLYFDAATYRLVKTVAQTAQGADTVVDSDYQTVQGVPIAMRSVETDPSGTTTVTTTTHVQLSTALPSGALARPPYISRGRISGRVSVPFRSSLVGRVGHIVVPVMLDGKMATLVFDSGGGNFLVPSAATRLGLKTSGAMATGGAGTTEQMSGFAPVNVVNFGGARLMQQNFLVTPLGFALLHPRMGVAPEGLIGYEYLANFRVIVRYADRRLDVEPFGAAPPPGGVTLPFVSDSRHAYVKATIDGVDGYYLLDTGNAGGLVLNAPFVAENHLFPNGGITYESPGGVGGGFSVIAAMAKSFSLAGVTFSDVPITIPQVTSGFFATRGVAGNLGAGILSRYTLVFDFRAQTVTFIPNRDVNRPFLVDRAGLSLNQSGPSAFEVRQVVPHSAAAEAGIVAGDRIVAFDGKLVKSGYGTGDLSPLLVGTRPFTLTIERGGSTTTVRITPHALITTAQ